MAGNVKGNITYCYVEKISRSNNANASIGGLCGQLSGGNINHCYIFISDGTFGLVAQSGMLVGIASSGSITHCFVYENNSSLRGGGTVTVGSSQNCFYSINSLSDFNTKWPSGWTEFNVSDTLYPPDLKELPRSEIGL